MSAESASSAEIEITDAAPVADLSGGDIATVADSTVPAANDPAFTAPEPEAEPKAFEDTAKKGVDPYNDTAGNDDTFDNKSKRFGLDRMAGENTIGQAGGGPLSQPSNDEREEKKQEAIDDFFDMVKERYEEQQRQEEHARKWDQEMHEIAGVRASGEDFNKARDFLKTPEGKKKVIEALQQQNLTKEQAEKVAKRTEEFQDLLNKKRLGIASPEEEKRITEMAREKDVQLGLKTTVDLSQKYGMTIKSDKKVEADSIKGADVQTIINSSIPANKNKEDTRVLEARNNFASARVLTGEFSEAKAAIKPLDNPSFGLDNNKPAIAVAALNKVEVVRGIEL